jgi:UDP-2,4-diacetamido-2,4,6-trideoxy-beta-L-altropyranose hydrolase
VDVILRTDASLEIGTGHVMRCLTLAQALRGRGARCRFVSRLHPGHMVDALRAAGFDVLALPEPELYEAAGETRGLYSSWLGADPAKDAEQTSAALRDGPADWLIVDHYGIDERWETAMRPACRRLLAIDDLADRPHNCDMLLDQTFGRNSADYAGLVPGDCVMLTGSGYALLRPEFTAGRPASLQRQRRQIRRLLIAMGGVDLHNVTSRVLLTLGACDLLYDIEVDVVLGRQAPWQEKVRQVAGQLPFAVRVHVGIDAMAELMASCDLAIGAAGTTALERCCLGLPTIALILAPNQREGAFALLGAGAVAVIDSDEGLEQALAAAWRSASTPGALAQMSAAAAALCDGRGAEIVSDRIMHG